MQNNPLRNIFHNLIALGITQGSMFIVPLITLPYLVTVIGIENYGKVSWARAILVYAGFIVDYGFNVSATTQIAKANGDNHKIQKIFHNVIFSKSILLGCSIGGLFILAMVWPQMNIEIQMFVYGSLIVVGQSFYPLWYYQGIQKMKIIGILGLITSFGQLLLFFVFIHEESHYQYVILIYGCLSLAQAIAGYLIAFKDLGRKSPMKFISKAEVRFQFKEGFHLFLTNFAINFYASSQLLFLSLFSTTLNLGIYSVADRVTQALKSMVGVFNQSTYPYVCSIINNKEQIQIFYKTVFRLFWVGLLLFCGLFIIFAPNIIGLFVDDNLSEVLNLLYILVPIPLIVALHIPTGWRLLALGMNKSFSKVIVVGSIISLFLQIVFVANFELKGLAAATVITEIIILIGFVIFQKRTRQYV